jgi:hypothetical protein
MSDNYLITNNLPWAISIDGNDVADARWLCSVVQDFARNGDPEAVEEFLRCIADFADCHLSQDGLVAVVGAYRVRLERAIEASS